MSLLICPECGGQVSAAAHACPECGCPMYYIKAHGRRAESQFSAASDRSALEAGAALGDPEAMYWLGYCFYYGENDFPDDEEAAEKWLRKAASAGHTDAARDVQEWFSAAESVPKVFPSNQELRELFFRFENLVVFDVETSGLRPETDQIIELAAIRVRPENGKASVVETFDEKIRLPEGQWLSTKITELTGITTEDLRRNGKMPEDVCRNFLRLLVPSHTLMIAYNAQFDMGFLQSLLRRHGEQQTYIELHALDGMTVYKDRREYPHKLSDAIQAYGLTGVRNSHRAIDDAHSLLQILLAMDRERSDLEKYIDLFGYNPKWGISGAKLPGIRYLAQPYFHTHRLYE